MKRAVFDSTKYERGDFVLCKVTDYAQNTLFCEAEKLMGVQEFASFNRK